MSIGETANSIAQKNLNMQSPELLTDQRISEFDDNAGGIDCFQMFNNIDKFLVEMTPTGIDDMFSPQDNAEIVLVESTSKITNGTEESRGNPSATVSKSHFVKSSISYNIPYSFYRA